MALPPTGRPASPAQSAGAVFKGLVKLVAIIAFLALMGSLLIRGALGPEQHGRKALDSGDPLVGAMLGTWPSEENQAIKNFESSTKARLDIVDIFVDWMTPFENVSHSLLHVADKGSLAMLSWEPHGVTTQHILDGTKDLYLRDGRKVPVDEYIEEFAKGMCDVALLKGQPVLLRMMHEMNGHWFSWGISHENDQGQRPNTNESYKAAWKKIHDVFRDHCSSGVLFVWAINHFSVGTGTSFTGTYPGDDYVDWVGLDGYNWGTNAYWGWQDFDTIFSPSYCEVTRSISKPVLLAEIATTEKGGDKAAWILDMFRKLDQGTYPQVRGFVWFDYPKFEIEIRGPMDWPVGSSAKSLQAFSQGAQALQGTGDAGVLKPRADGPNC